MGIISGKRVLDVGFGYGEVLNRVLQNGGNAYGIEIAEDAYNSVRRAMPQAVVRIAPAESIPFDNNFFDIVLCSGSLEHFVDLDVGLAEIKRVLRTEGALIVVVPNKNWLGQLYLYKLLNKWFGRDQPIERELSLKKWLTIIERNGFSIRCWQPWNIDINLPLAHSISLKSEHIRAALCYHFVIKATPF